MRNRKRNKSDLGKDLRVYAVTGGDACTADRVCQSVEKAVRGGVSMIQLRQKNMDTPALTELAEKVKKITDRYNVPLIIDDDAAAAKMSGADGVHIGQDDISVMEARRTVGTGGIIGVTAHTVDEAVKAEADGADYIGAGAVFDTSSKSNTTPLSIEMLGGICDSVSIPVVAIGGVNQKNAARLAGTGIAGCAAISSIFGVDDITRAAADMADAVSRMLGTDGYRAAIFDYDGTVLNSMPMWETAASRFVRKLGHEPEPGFDEYVKYMTLEESAEKFRAYGATGTDGEIIDQIMDVVYDSYRYELQPKPGVIDVLEYLKSCGVHMSVATQTPSKMILAANERLGLDRYFEGVFSCMDWDTNKHFPDIYYLAAAYAGAAPRESLVFEDMIYAADTADKAGFTVVGVYDKSSEKDRPSIEKSSTVYLDSYADWPGLEKIMREREGH